ncbi:MAG: methionyl-tRNA formyltransferase [Rhodothermales bacterium]|nr:methionyl-tRNA formyltransferase [Rhodothermales bacterium]MBO6778453.1 methionyl-tRNA formyltransferase [Rhodothermales bacterium]
MRIIFMGTPDFAVPSLRALARAGYTPIAVVTSPDKARGRGRKVSPTPVKLAAQELGIETILQPESVKALSFAEQIEALDADLQVVVAFRILPPAVFEAARLGAFNLHGSLLPRYRGAAPIHRAVIAGDTVTGVTTFFLKKKVDTGNMILQRAMPIGTDDTTGDVHDRMMLLGASAVVETVRLIGAGKAEPLPQDDAQATPAPKVFRDQAEIDWSLTDAEVHNHIRGHSPVPGAWTVFGGKAFKVYRSRIAEGSGLPGEILEARDRLVVACGTSAVQLTEVQPQGRRRMGAEAFLNGTQVDVGTILPA